MGDNILVAPLFNDEGDRKLYLPKGTWYDLFGEQSAGSGRRKQSSARRSRSIAFRPTCARAL